MRRIGRYVTACGLALGLCGACGGGGDAKKPAPAGKGDPVEAKQSAGEAATQPAADVEDLPAAEDLFSAHVEAVGGDEAIAKFETLYSESSVDTGAQNIKAKAKTWWKGGRFYGEQEIPGFGVAKSGYDGTTVWVDDPINGLRKLEGKEAEQNIRWGSVFLVSDWKSHFKSAQTVGVHEVDGRRLYDVKLTSVLGDEVTMSFADDDKLLARMSFSQIMPTGTVPVTAVFGDYREVGGVKIAHLSTLDFSLGAVSQTYDKIEINAEVDESRFAYPGSGGAVEAKGPPKDAQNPQSAGGG